MEADAFFLRTLSQGSIQMNPTLTGILTGGKQRDFPLRHADGNSPVIYITLDSLFDTLCVCKPLTVDL